MAGLGTYRRRGKTSWELRFDAPRDEPGSRKRRHVTVRGDKAAAEKKLTELLRERDTGSAIDPSKTTLGQYLDQWVDEIEVEPTTRQRYRQLIANQITPHIGSAILQELSAASIKGWHKTLRDCGRKQRKAGEEKPRPLADRTILHAHRCLGTALKEAKILKLIAANPVADYRQPKVKTAKRIEVFKEPRAVLEKLSGHELNPIASLAFATGARRGELLALRWTDCDLGRGVVKIERSLEELADGSLRFKAPKTEAGVRDITIPPPTVAMLREHHTAQLRQRMLLGLGKPDADALVFPGIDGGPMSPDRLSWRWRNTCRTLGLPRASFHAWRHTHASALIAAKEDVVTVSRRLGHSKPSVTLDTYSHFFAKDDSSAALAIGRLLG
jgi:integrase